MLKVNTLTLSFFNSPPLTFSSSHLPQLLLLQSKDRLPLQVGQMLLLHKEEPDLHATTSGEEDVRSY